jgi:DNA-binding transcriptional LysR family regulator
MPALAARLANVAPSMRVYLVDLVPDDRVSALERYEVDFALLPQTQVPDWADAEPIFRSSFSVIARKDHPQISANGIEPGDVVPLDLFCELGHVLFSTHGTPFGFGDAALKQIGRKRTVIMTLPVFSGVYRAVAGSDLIALLPTALAQRISEASGLSVFKPPIPIEFAQLTIVWHRRVSKSPHHLWLKDQIHKILGQYDSA